MMRSGLVVGAMIGLFAIGCGGVAAQPTGAAQINWEVANRFRLFAEQKDFDNQVKEYLASSGKSVLAAEQTMETRGDGQGWASRLGALCYDTWRGRIIPRCKRDGVTETYINPIDARVRLTVKLPDDFGDATCAWQVGSGGDAQKFTANCGVAITKARVSTHRPTPVAVVATSTTGRTAQASIDIQVRDLLIVGMGDSIASGEGNPMTPVALSAHGFCFERALGLTTRRFYLPGRENAAGVLADCPQPHEQRPDDRENWDAAAAPWLYNQCHRSLYSYQARVALALAIENPHISVTYLPLGCTGATIREGLLDSQQARERPKQPDTGKKPGPYVEGQISQLRNYLLLDGRRTPFRPIDLLMLTVGANDIGFSGLVANIIIAQNPERKLAIKGKVIVTPDQARQTMHARYRHDFRRLRRALAPLTGDSLKNVLFTTYGNPGTYDGGKPCPSTRRGFDGHPAFAVDGDRLADTVKFVNSEFLPELKKYVTCGDGGHCRAPARQAMKFVDGHAQAFADHGFCAKSDSDPAFDRICFRDGDSFAGNSSGLNQPMTHCRNASLFKPYAVRARWIRTANDSYFTAMTYPTRQGLLSSPSNIHDAIWGLESVVYGGAIHPTAEGHAAMADAALPEARTLLGLPPP